MVDSACFYACTPRDVDEGALLVALEVVRCDTNDFASSPESRFRNCAHEAAVTSPIYKTAAVHCDCLSKLLCSALEFRVVTKGRSSKDAYASKMGEWS